MAAFLDSNVLIDLLAEPSPWQGWSTERVLEWAERGPLIINDIVYAEVSVGFEDQGDLDATIDELGLDRLAPDREALFAAGKAFRRYRQGGGARDAVLPDFMIGAHAERLGIPLITRDERRFRTYFPGLILVSPEGRLGSGGRS
jgi:predicted nucleic acid-binding protein